MQATRLLLATRGGGFSAPAGAEFALTSAPDGGWDGIHIQPTYHNGTTYFAYNANGDMCVRSYDHSTETVSAETVMHAALDTDMVHASPSLAIDPSTGKVLVSYSAHGGAAQYLWTSTNAEDISAGSEANLDASLGGSDYTYSHLFFLGTTAWMIVRGTPGGTSQQFGYATSTDGGATWSALTNFFTGTATRFGYIEATKTSESRIDFAALSLNGDSSPPSSLYHAYYDGSFRKTDGTVITPVFDTDDMTLVWNATPDDSLSSVVTVKLRDGKPVLLTADAFPDTTVHVRYARWTGSAWTSSEVLSDLAAGLAIVTPNVFLASRLVATYNQVYRYTTTDGGTTWVPVALTSGSTHHLRAVPVVNAASDLRYLWLEGSSTGTVGNTTLGIVGWGT